MRTQGEDGVLNIDIDPLGWLDRPLFFSERKTQTRPWHHLEKGADTFFFIPLFLLS